MTPERGRLLLDLARAAISEEWGGPKMSRPAQEAWLEEPAALFVSLHRQGELRGCIGTMEARHPLFEEVIDKAKAAAFHDPRMAPVRSEELPELDIDITLLHPLEPIAAGSEEELLRQLRPGRDGLVLQSREGRALFIPSVWKQLPDPGAFLQALMHKAQLRRWPPDLRAFRFTADEVSSAAVEASHGG